MAETEQQPTDREPCHGYRKQFVRLGVLKTIAEKPTRVCPGGYAALLPRWKIKPAKLTTGLHNRISERKGDNGHDD